MRHSIGFGLLPVVAGCYGQPKQLPPREPPPRVVPEVIAPVASVPPSGSRPSHGKLLIDTTDGPMVVRVQYDPSFVPPGGVPAQARSGELCTTPCVAELPTGRYRFYFSAAEGTEASRGDSDDITITEGTHVYRRAPGRYDTPDPTDQIGPIALIVVGIAAATGGMIMAFDDDSSKAAAYSLIGAGAAVGIGGGVWSYDASRAEVQEGATTFWQLP